MDTSIGKTGGEPKSPLSAPTLGDPETKGTGLGQFAAQDMMIVPFVPHFPPDFVFPSTTQNRLKVVPAEGLPPKTPRKAAAFKEPTGRKLRKRHLTSMQQPDGENEPPGRIQRLGQNAAVIQITGGLGTASSGAPRETYHSHTPLTAQPRSYESHKEMTREMVPTTLAQPQEFAKKQMKYDSPKE